jgi:hypothetical protein
MRVKQLTEPIADVRVHASAYMKSHPGHAFCDACLALKLGLGVREVRHARIGLAGCAEFEQQTGFCSVCLEVKHIIHMAWLHFDSPGNDEALPFGA